MFTRPPDLADSAVAEALADGWGLVVDEVEYATVGFGSHHWRAAAGGQRWFVTVDDLDARRRDASDDRRDAAARLTAALRTAHRLRSGGLDFVIAPEPTLPGNVLHPIDERYVVALYRYVDGRTHAWGVYDSHAQRAAVLARIAAIHAATPAVRDVVVVDDFSIPHRRGLLDAVDDGTSWGPGPFADRAAELLGRHTDELLRVLRHYDRLVDTVRSAPDRFVVTHGEPHCANTIETSEGVVLIDWDTTLLAPPERDLWMLIGEDLSIADEYTALTGVEVDRAAIELHRLWWDLCEISLYVAEFRAPHLDTEDTRTVWVGLCEHLDPTRWEFTG